MSVDRLGRVLAHVRSAVRSQQPYIVGGDMDSVAIKLNQNESPLDLPADIREQILKAWSCIPANRYPAEQPQALCSAIARHTDWTSDGIIAGNGSNELTYLVGMACVEPGVKVVLPRPMFSFYKKVVKLFGGDVISVGPKPDLRFDAVQLLAEIRRYEPSLTVLVTPNNPTGMAMPLAEVREIAGQTAGLLLVDEAYVEFSSEPSAQELLADFPNVILLRTFSKALGLAGIRLGYLMGHPDLIAELIKARIPFMVDRFSTHAALVLLEQAGLLQERVEMMRSETRRLYTALKSMQGFEVLPTQANFVTFKPPVDDQWLMRKLLDKGILVRNMGGYTELRGYLRVNAGTPMENRAFLQALQST